MHYVSRRFSFIVFFNYVNIIKINNICADVPKRVNRASGVTIYRKKRK